jgi:hypothetical protein
MRAGFDLPHQPAPSDIYFLLAGQPVAIALKASEAQARNSNHGLFSLDWRAASTARTRHAKEEKFRAVPLG